MARKGNIKLLESPIVDPVKWSKEIIGLAFGACGLVLLLALVSYNPANLPEWGVLQAFSKAGNQSNLIGPVGGLLALLHYLLFGAAAWMIPLALIWFGISKALMGGSLWPRMGLGFVGALLAAAAFLHVANWFFVDWARDCRISSATVSRPGGLAGELLGG